jgi:hypothetical protein
MKYIAFRGTYNEQIFDTETLIISWTFNDATVQCTPDFKPKLTRKTWKRYETVD